MEEHWHNVYVAETVSEAVKSLRSHGIKVDYSPKPEDPEDANGYIEQNGGVISSCVRWRTSKDPKFAAGTPKEAMSCLQLLSSATNFAMLRSATERNLSVVQDCRNC